MASAGGQGSDDPAHTTGDIYSQVNYAITCFNLPSKTEIDYEFTNNTLNEKSLIRCLPYLCENLNAEETDEKTTLDKTQKLITLIQQRGSEVFICFMDCLIETNQHHIYNKLIVERRNLAQCKNNRLISMKLLYKYKCIFAITIGIGLIALMVFSIIIVVPKNSSYYDKCSSHGNLSSIQDSLRKSYQERFRSVVPLSLPFTFDTENNWVDLTLKMVDASISTTKELAAFLKNEYVKVKMLIIEGDPGTGKTSLLRRIAIEWGQKETQWNHYDLVIHAEFRKVRQKNFTRITELLTDYLSDYLEKQDFEQLVHFINNSKCCENHNILVLLDGYDESSLKEQCQELSEYLFSVTIGKSLLFKVVLTSRRGFLSELRGQKGRFIFADLLGFTTNLQKEAYIKKYFTAKNKIQSTKSINYVNNLLDTNKSLKILSDTPLLLTFICLVHHKIKHGSKLELYMNTIWWLLDRYQRNNPDQDIPRLFGFQHSLNEENSGVIESNYRHFPQLHMLGRMGMEDLFRSTLNKTDLEKFNISAIIQQVGLLRKEVTRDDSFHMRTEYSFPHRTIQEFFIAFAFFYCEEEPPRHFEFYFNYPYKMIGLGTIQRNIQSFLDMFKFSDLPIAMSRRKRYDDILERSMNSHRRRTPKSDTRLLPESENNIDFNYSRIENIPHSLEEAIILLKKEADQGLADAQYFLGFIYGDGLLVKKNDEEAIKWYTKAAKQGYAVAQNNLGLFYRNGYGVDKSYEDAVKWFREAAEQENAGGQFNLGIMYQYGWGVNISYEEAVQWYSKAAQQGRADAQNRLGEMYVAWGENKSREEAEKWYRKVAEQGNGGLYLQLKYQNGGGDEELDKEAVTWYWLAALQENADGQCNLGYMYENGRGVSQSGELAAIWYRTAAEQGHAGGQNNLGRMYLYGYGVNQSSEEAMKMFRKAAEQGHPDGQNNLGVMYQNGWGVDKSDEEAVIWFRKAAEQGHTEAKYALENIK